MSRVPLEALRVSVVLLLAPALACLGTCWVRNPRVARLLNTHAQRLQRELRYLRHTWSARDALIAHALLLGVSCAAAATIASALALALPIAAAFAPSLWLAHARRARSAQIDGQLDTWLVLLSNALRATPSLGQAIDDSAARIGAPLGDELHAMLAETRLGAPLDRALDALGERVQSPALYATLTTLRVARNAGGDLSATLDDAAASLREMARLSGVLRSKTAEGRAQSALIALIPLPLIALLDALSPALLSPLWSTPRGHVIAGGALALWLLALALARKITAVEV